MKMNIYFSERGYSFNNYARNCATVKNKVKRKDHLFTHQQYVNLIYSSRGLIGNFDWQGGEMFFITIHIM